MEKQLLYFGCRRQKGHYLFFGQNHVDARTLQHKFPNENISFLRYLDGIYAPQTKGYEEQGLYQEVNIGGFKILAWWDRSFDDRHASNSALIGHGYNSADEMLADYKVKYSDVANRQPMPTKFLPPSEN